MLPLTTIDTHAPVGCATPQLWRPLARNPRPGTTGQSNILRGILKAGNVPFEVRTIPGLVENYRSFVQPTSL
jgi:hypothetical protein